MNFLDLLSVRQKITLITIISFLSFIVFMLISGSAVNNTNERLNKISTTYYPVLVRSTANVVLLERMVEGFALAVTIGEEDPLDKNAEILDEMNKTFAEQQQYLGENSSNLNLISNETTAYYEAALQLAKDMINGTLALEQMAERAGTVAKKLETIQQSLNRFKTQNQDDFTAVLTEVNEAGEQTLQVMIATSIVAIVLLAIISWFISGQIVSQIKKVSRSLQEIAEGDGDLTVRLTHNGKDEFRDLVFWFNSFIDKMQLSIGDIITNVNQLTTMSDQLSSTSSHSHQQVASQNSAISQTTEALTEMFTSVKHIAMNATEAADSATDADKEAHTGGEIVNETIRGINQLSDELVDTAKIVHQLESYTNNVEVILGTIRAIADQTNLLALNAAIEAARAGEQGRGFAVVADEVRTLASRTQDSTQEINQVLEELQQASKNAVSAMNRGTKMADHCVQQSGTASNSLNEITTKVSLISSVNEQIAAATEEQQRTSELIQTYIDDIQKTAKESLETTTELDGVSQSLSNITLGLGKVTSQFRI